MKRKRKKKKQHSHFADHVLDLVQRQLVQRELPKPVHSSSWFCSPNKHPPSPFPPSLPPFLPLLNTIYSIISHGSDRREKKKARRMTRRCSFSASVGKKNAPAVRVLPAFLVWKFPALSAATGLRRSCPLSLAPSWGGCLSIVCLFHVRSFSMKLRISEERNSDRSHCTIDPNRFYIFLGISML